MAHKVESLISELAIDAAKLRSRQDLRPCELAGRVRLRLSAVRWTAHQGWSVEVGDSRRDVDPGSPTQPWVTATLSGAFDGTARAFAALGLENSVNPA